MVIIATYYLGVGRSGVPEYVEKVGDKKSTNNVLTLIREFKSKTFESGRRKIFLASEMEKRLPPDSPPALKCMILTEKQSGARKIYDRTRTDVNRERLYKYTREALNTCTESIINQENDITIAFELKSLFLVGFGSDGLDESEGEYKAIKAELLEAYSEALKERVRQTESDLQKTGDKQAKKRKFLKRQVEKWKEINQKINQDKNIETEALLNNGNGRFNE